MGNTKSKALKSLEAPDIQLAQDVYYFNHPNEWITLAILGPVEIKMSKEYITPFTFDPIPDADCGTLSIKSQSTTYYLTTEYYETENPAARGLLNITTNIPNIASPDQKNKFAFWNITTTGKIYNIGSKKNITRTASGDIIFDDGDLAFTWRITTIPPPAANGAPSLWDSTYPYPINQGDDYTVVDDIFSNKPGGDTGDCMGKDGGTYACSFHCGGGCDHDQGIAYGPKCGSVKTSDRTLCYLNKWDENNKNDCAAGNKNMLKNVKGKWYLDYQKCKNLHNFVLDRVNVNPPNKGAWAPWTKEVANTPIVRKFCEQVDTLTGKPMFISNRNCNAIVASEHEIGNIIQDSFCTRYPGTPFCVKHCKGRACYKGISAYCNGNKLNQEACQIFCNEKDENCDKRLVDYVATLTEEEKVLSEIAPCFRSQQFYENLYRSFDEKGIRTDLPKMPELRYGPCSIAKIKTYNFKQGLVQWPNIYNCFQELNIDVHGNITGDVKIDQSQQCDFHKEPSICENGHHYNPTTQKCEICPVNQTSIDGKVCKECGSTQKYENGKCFDCGEGEFPSDDKKTCKSCPSEMISKNGKCETCPERFIKKDKLTCKECKANEISIPDSSAPFKSRCKKCIGMVIKNKCFDCYDNEVYLPDPSGSGGKCMQCSDGFEKVGSDCIEKKKKSKIPIIAGVLIAFFLLVLILKRRK